MLECVYIPFSTTQRRSDRQCGSEQDLLLSNRVWQHGTSGVLLVPFFRINRAASICLFRSARCKQVSPYSACHLHSPHSDAPDSQMLTGAAEFLFVSASHNSAPHNSAPHNSAPHNAASLRSALANTHHRAGCCPLTLSLTQHLVLLL